MPRASRAAPLQPSFQRIDRGNAADRIVDDLRMQIIDGRLGRGTRLPTERQLAQAYGVSGATIREAVRGLATMRLVEVRHGSGAYVTADAQQLLAFSLAAMIRLEGIGPADVLGVLGVLNSYAAELAAQHATEDDIVRMTAALDAIDDARDATAFASGLKAFLTALAHAGRNPLVGVLSDFLASLQIGLAREMARGSMTTWRNTVSQLDADRRRLVNAIRRRNVEAARRAARAYHANSLKVVTALPEAQATRLSQGVLAGLLTGLTTGKSPEPK